MTQQHTRRTRAAKDKCRPFACQLAMQGGSATLDISGVIGWDTDPMDFCSQVQAAKDAGCTALTVRINSCGGYCYDGLAMGDKLRACGMRTRAEVCGQAMSMASYLLQCCDERVAHPNATIMFHQPSAGVYGTVDEIAEQARYLCAMRDKMFADMAARCGTTGEAMIAAHQGMKFYTAAQALQNGMIDSIMDAATDAVPEAAAAQMPVCLALPRAKRRVVDYDPALSLLPAMQAAPGQEQEEEQEEGRDDSDAGKTAAPAEEGEDPEKDKKEKREGKPAPAAPPHRPAPEKGDESQDDETPEGGEADEDDGNDEEPDSAPVSLTRAKLRAVMRLAAQQGAAAALARLGVPPACLPGNGAAGSALASPPADDMTASRLDKMPAMQRLAVLESNPRLAARYLGGNR